MRFKLTIDVDKEALQQTYRKGLELEDYEEIPDIKEIIQFECEGWLPPSGIHVVDIKEVKE